MDGLMNRLLPPARRVAIALTLTVTTVIGCQRGSELANKPEQPVTPVSAPQPFNAPDNVRPMTQLAAHLSISEAYKNIVDNPHISPERTPPVESESAPNPSVSLDKIRFPLKIERSVKPEQSAPSEITPQVAAAPINRPSQPPGHFDTPQAPLDLNPPTIAPPSQQSALILEPSPQDLPQRIAPPIESHPRFETVAPQPAPVPRQTIEPNYLRNLPPTGRFTQDNAQPKPNLDFEAPQGPFVSGPPASFVSLAPAATPANPALAPARNTVEDLKGPGLSVPAPRQPARPSPEQVTPPPQSRPEIDHALIAVRGRMNSLVDHGLVLAQRGAYFSARAEFIQALRLATQTLDTAERTHRHSDALAEALAALDEAGDFIPSGARLEANVDLDLVVSSHRTPVLKDKDLEHETTLTATQQYFSFAQQKLMVACAGIPETSRALVGMGRIQEYLYQTAGDNRTLIGPRSIALFQTALAIDGRNFEAANELGVLLARYGQFEEAKQALLQGVKSVPRPEIWQNLASIHETLGELELAQRAKQEAEMAQQFVQLNGDLNTVRWVTPEEMARHGQANANLKQSVPADNIPPIAQRRTTQSTR
ncbi:hypothetical protein DTL42_06325 [Bremerella cremea]|uniref:Tetratricopeptide repeat protein n=2 Tax=Bremerella cremea TaxID=1031537 RepID=A0A368KWL0_9BACT|nr:hypothetical protein DTL42_06325 [Bremerella cremea]